LETSTSGVALPGRVRTRPAAGEPTATNARGASLDDDALETLAASDERARRLPPVAIVIAAHDEEGAIGRVLDGLPATLCGLPVAPIVVVDGSTDETAHEARRHGAIVCDVPVQRGQGAALRLGYRIAREGGARYVVTTDADGQYDAAEAERLLEPVLSGEADFVSGSRMLGRDETTDRVRKLGVRVFAAVISVLTLHRITDPAFGLRAMRAEVTGAIELEQPQYQAAEVLIGVIARGFRAAERPATMRRRKTSASKKGKNALYGIRFARVIGTTWWREARRKVGLASRGRGE
jgi:glycosyltransferase involved in cell wall biosynthesis